MFRKILIAAVASLSLLSPLALPAATEAHDTVAYHHTYRVYYRSCAHEAWRFGGSYRHREDAYRQAHHLRVRGLEAYVR